MSYHEPVLLQACIEGLNIRPDGVYVDVTFGGGGHSKAIISHLENGRLIGFDQDADARNNIPADPKFTFIAQNFRHLKKYLRFYGIRQIDGLLADLGVSSHQFDEADRGFTFREDAALDMRMNQSGGKSAKELLNEYSPEDLARIFRTYGELNNAWKLAQAIAGARIARPIETTHQLREILMPFVPKKQWHKFLAQVFQAIRIEVNEEMDVLKELLEQCAEVIKPGGRLVVISYHSLEDRLVKNYIRCGKFEGEAEKDFYGNLLVPFQAVNRKPMVPGDEEQNSNPRSRSAKLRIAERTTYTAS
jgi:16S rRNA (cytosine1402-N4)-methyltransferase